MDVYVKIRKRSYTTLLAICDVELMGRILRQGNVVFEIREEFYKGKKVSVEEAVDLIKSSNVVNMIGEDVVNRAVEEGLIHPEAIIKISGIPHAQIIKM